MDIAEHLRDLILGDRLLFVHVEISQGNVLFLSGLTAVFVLLYDLALDHGLLGLVHSLDRVDHSVRLRLCRGVLKGIYGIAERLCGTGSCVLGRHIGYGILHVLKGFDQPAHIDRCGAVARTVA